MNSSSPIAVLLVFFFGALAPATIGQLVPTIPLLAAEMALTAAQAGLIVSLPSAVPALFGLAGGWAVDRWGERTILLVGAAALLAGNLVVLHSADFTALVLGRLLEGVAYLCLTVAGASLMIRITAGPRRTRAMALWGTVVPVGFGGSMFLVSIQHADRWQVGFVGLAVLAAVAMACVAVLPAPLATSPHSRRTAGLIAVIRKGTAFRLGLAFGANALLQTGIVTVLPQLLAMRFHLSHEVGGLITSAQMVTNALAALLAGILLNRQIAPRTVALIGLAITVVCGVGIFAREMSLTAEIAVALTFTLGTGLVTGLASALLPQVAPTPDTMGATSGLVFQCVLIGVAIGPPVLFAVLASHSFISLVGVISATTLASMVLLPVWGAAHRGVESHAAGRHLR